MPDAVIDLVEERLARLNPITERLLMAVAAIGPSAPVALAARAAGISEQDAERAVVQALSERLVDEVAAARPTIAFPHALIREALTAGADGATGARLHISIAYALEEDPHTEPAELARHYGLAVAVAGTERVIAAYKAAALAAAERHDHEQAAAHLRSALALLSGAALSSRATLLLELGGQELLAADLPRAREAFRAAGDAARSSGDTGTLARAALGFAGGDIGFGWEMPSDDTSTVGLLREGLDALGDSEPRLALRMILRLAYALTYTDDDYVLAALARRAGELDQQLGDAESQVLAHFTKLIAACARGPDPLGVLNRLEEFLELSDMAEGWRPGGPALPHRPMVGLRPLHARAYRGVRACGRACCGDRTAPRQPPLHMGGRCQSRPSAVGPRRSCRRRVARPPSRSDCQAPAPRYPRRDRAHIAADDRMDLRRRDRNGPRGICSDGGSWTLGAGVGHCDVRSSGRR